MGEGEPSLLGAVLAGGRSRRLGRPKALVSVGGVPMGLRAAQALTASCSPVVAITGSEAIAKGLGLSARPDIEEGQGPLTGIFTALSWAREIGAPGTVILGCDMPFVCSTVIRRLVQGWRGCVHVAAGPSGREPMCGVYGVEIYDVIERSRSDGAWSVQDFLTEVGASSTDPDLLESLGTHAEIFFNVNTQGDLAAAEERWAAARAGCHQGMESDHDS